MLNSISRACIQQAVHAGSLCVTTTISVVFEASLSLFNFGENLDFPDIPSKKLYGILPWSENSKYCFGKNVNLVS